MDLKSLFKVMQLKEMSLILLAPIALGGVESFYKFDVINIPLLIYTAVIVFLLGIVISAFHTLSLYRHKVLFELESVKGISESINVSTIRKISYISLALAIILAIGLIKMTKIDVIFPFAITIILFILYDLGPKPLWKTSLDEVVYSFGIGFLLSSFVTYSQVYFEVSNLFVFYVLMLWVSLPIVLGLACMKFVYNEQLSKHDTDFDTLASIMGEDKTFMVMEVATGLACLMPCIAIYLNDMPWTELFIWLMYPKLVWNLRNYKEEKALNKKLYYIRENTVIIVVFQLLLTIFGIFF